MRPNASPPDADLNLGMATVAVQTAEAGIYICMFGDFTTRLIEIETGQYYFGRRDHSYYDSAKAQNER
jgi:hypothetical protein